MQDEFYLELLSNEMGLPSLYGDLVEQFEMFLHFLEISFENCSSVQLCKKKSHKPPWFYNKVENTISKKKQAMKRVGKKPIALKETRLLRSSRKKSFTTEGAK